MLAALSLVFCWDRPALSQFHRSAVVGRLGECDQLQVVLTKFVFQSFRKCQFFEILCGNESVLTILRLGRTSLSQDGFQIKARRRATQVETLTLEAGDPASSLCFSSFRVKTWCCISQVKAPNPYSGLRRCLAEAVPLGLNKCTLSQGEGERHSSLLG